MADYLRTKAAIEAEEALRTAAAVALGSGSMKKGAAQQLRSAWLRLSQAGTGPRHGKAPPLAAMGIGVEIVGDKNDKR